MMEVGNVCQPVKIVVILPCGAMLAAPLIAGNDLRNYEVNKPLAAIKQLRCYRRWSRPAWCGRVLSIADDFADSTNATSMV